MKVYYYPETIVDCTSDPHPVRYDDATMKEMMDDVVRVCASDMVQAIESVRAEIDGVEYESDRYVDWNRGEEHPPASGPMAQKHKTEGLWFYSDATVPATQHIPPGLSGVEAVADMISKGATLGYLSIGVVWSFAGTSSCSDYIKYAPDEYGVNCISFGSQDWWISSPKYEDWCQQMADFLQRPFPYAAEDGTPLTGTVHPR